MLFWKRIVLWFAAIAALVGIGSPIRSAVGSRQTSFIGKKILPFDSEVEYLRNDGLTQYIDTGILGGAGLRVVAEVTPLQEAYDKWIIGAYDQNARIYIGYQYYSKAWGGGYGHYFSGKTAMELGKKVILDVEYTDSQQIIYINGELGEIFNKSGFTGYVTKSIWLFGLHYTDTNPRSFLCEIGRCQMFINGELVRDFIPCRADGIGCMYDMVTERLFANEGSGSFVIGPDL